MKRSFLFALLPALTLGVAACGSLEYGDSGPSPGGQFGSSVSQSSDSGPGGTGGGGSDSNGSTSNGTPSNSTSTGGNTTSSNDSTP
jgi:hypothetical protein